MMQRVSKHDQEIWIRAMIDMVTMVRSRKCPECGSKVVVVSGDVMMAVYCEKCQKFVTSLLVIGEGVGKDEFWFQASENECWEV